MFDVTPAADDAPITVRNAGVPTGVIEYDARTGGGVETTGRAEDDDEV